MIFKSGRYSGYLRPISYFIDLLIINVFANSLFENHGHFLNYILFISLTWIFVSIKSNFYEIYRFTQIIKILSQIGKQTVLFSLLVFAFFGFYFDLEQKPLDLLQYVFTVIAVITISKLTIYFLLKKYRVLLGGNFRKVVILGLNQKTDQLRKFFNDNPDYGYKLQKTFNFNENSNTKINDVFNYILENNVDEIYSSIAELTNKQMEDLIDFADNNLKVLKFIPDNKEIYAKKLDFNYYGYLPIISLRSIPIEYPFNQFIKRSFDIIFSLFVIVGILSWLTPLLGLLIKIESKGPVFFKQKRNGLDYKEFYCYKYRSMKPNPTAHLHQVTKGDQRITLVGKIIRKTSIDELPQFINVLKGDMSIVGPRPHMVSHTHMYAERIDKFMVRHFIKPGITGLAQVTGYRGEVENDEHIINRVKYDIFYLENWSLLLDVKIVFQTVYNALKGDDKAY
ncbi:MAG: putative colanic acid biosynthesis UDP-glucose lipid carrier transferase [Urechidicola sp.]|jgi:putative colanic acid biosynthesis UDP-glucose lipid carrier transferase